jgi:hypothetical protein
MNNKGEGMIIKDVKYEEVKEKKTTTAVAIPLARHPLMSDKKMEYVKDIQEEADLDRHLGLNHQVRMDELDMIRHDIDELTKSTDYVEVSNKDIENLFGIGWIKVRCFVSTLVIFFKSPLGICLEVTAAFLLMGIFGVHTDNHKLAVIGFSAMTLVLVGILVQCATEGFEVYRVKVSMRRERIQDTIIRLPIGAKLKLKEAVDSKLFLRFDIVDPKIDVTSETLRAPRKMVVDPAIIGLTPDNRQFLIVCWDAENENLKVNQKNFKKLKLKQASAGRRSFDGYTGGY